MVGVYKNLYHDGRGRGIVYSNGLNTPVVMPGLLVVCCEELATSLMEYRRRSTFNSEGAIEGDWQNQTNEVQELLRRANFPGIMEIIINRHHERLLISALRQASTAKYTRDGLADEVKRNYLITHFLEYKELSKACKDRPDYERLIKEAAEKEINLELIRTKEEFVETNYSTIFIPVKLDRHLGLIVMDTGVRLM